VGESIERLVPARFRSYHAEYRKGFAADATRRSMGAGRDLYALHKDGSEVAVEIGLSPFETDGGAFAVAAVTDISARKQMESDLLERGRDAEHANRLKDQFLAHGVSRAPHAPERRSRLGRHPAARRDRPTKRARAVNAIYTNARRQVQLIDELLDVSRIISGKLRLERAA
jgi:signal transduction histidine kinase